MAGLCTSGALPADATAADSRAADSGGAADGAVDAASALCGQANESAVEAPCVSTFSAHHHYFDVEAKGAPISIRGLDTMSQNAGARVVSLYYKTGTYVGFETNGSAWTSLGTSASYSPTPGTACPLTTTAIPISFCVDVPANTRVAFYYALTSGTGTFETVSAQTPGAVVVEDTYMRLYVGSMAQGIGPAFSVTPTTGHAWQGTVHYEY